MTGPARRYRRTGSVVAHQLDRRVEWRTSSGDLMIGQPGDWLVESSAGSRRTVDPREFERTHERVAGDVWRRVGSVTAVPVTEPCEIATHEGVAHAERGDWIITSDDGWSWPVPGVVFEQTYEPIDESAGDAPAG